ncbi:MAG: S8 family serine peptidase [Vicinamibacterales bacterium]
MSTVIRGAAERERFAATGEGIVWALVDSGIDGSHPHFQRHENLRLPPPLRHRDLTASDLDQSDQELEALVDAFSHGTHIAGLIAGEATASPDVILRVDQQREGEHPIAPVGGTLDTISGLAPRCKLLSLKVLDDQGHGRASSTIEAVEWIREMNGQGALRIHGVTLAVSFQYDAEQYACGLSPLCVAVNELVRSGVVVVVAAGNAGFAHVQTVTGTIQAGAVMSISDPGNAELAITVGSTHSDAKTRGISYFSSKGPTADGRLKPDLVAPGERMLSCIPTRRSPDDATVPGPRVGRYAESTGGGTAVAFASGAIAALLSARPDLIGRPLDVKRLLTRTAQDLQRDRYAQGHGAIDLLRALEESRSTTPGAAGTFGSGTGEADLTLPSEAVPAAHPSSAADLLGAATAAVPGDRKKRFAVALSYPGERREYVQMVVRELRRTFSRAEIFYDRFHQAELVGPDLDVRLERIYRDDCELIAVFISSEYAAKEWTSLEWRIVRDVMKRRRAEQVIPLRFDETPIPGLLSIDAFVDLKDLDPEFAAALIVERIRLNRTGGNPAR